MEQLDYNLLFRWFVGLDIADPVWDPTVFSKNRDGLLAGDIARRFLEQVIAQASERGLTSDEHFSVDGTMIEAWASQKSFRRKDGSDDDPRPGRNTPAAFRGQSRNNDTHESKTDPQARLYRKGPSQEAKLAYLGHVVIEKHRGRDRVDWTFTFAMAAYNLTRMRTLAGGRRAWPRASRPRAGHAVAGAGGAAHDLLVNARGLISGPAVRGNLDGVSAGTN